MSLKYEPCWEPLHISAKQLFGRPSSPDCNLSHPRAPKPPLLTFDGRIDGQMGACIFEARVVCEKNRDPGRTATPAGGLGLQSRWSC